MPRKRIYDRVGRPAVKSTDFHAGWEDELLEMAMEGASKTQFNLMLGISKHLWNDLRKREDCFREITDHAMDLTQSYWEDIGRKGTIGELDVKPPMYAFNMVNRFPADYKTQRNQEDSTQTVITKELTDAELNEKIKDLQKDLNDE